LWGDTSVKKRSRPAPLSLRKEHESNKSERELSSSSFNFVDLSLALQGFLSNFDGNELRHTKIWFDHFQISVMD
jgi:hypothetical protein